MGLLVSIFMTSKVNKVKDTTINGSYMERNSINGTRNNK